MAIFVPKASDGSINGIRQTQPQSEVLLLSKIYRTALLDPWPNGIRHRGMLDAIAGKPPRHGSGGDQNRNYAEPGTVSRKCVNLLAQPSTGLWHRTRRACNP